MSTAKEIELTMQQAQPKIEAIAQAFEALMPGMMSDCLHIAIGRKVSAKRARKLRKRGDDVRYAGRTETGKARYRWIQESWT